MFPMNSNEMEDGVSIKMKGLNMENNDIADLPAGGFSTNLSDRKRNERGKRMRGRRAR